MKHEMSRRGNLGRIVTGKVWLLPVYSPTSSTFYPARQTRVGGRCRGQSWTGTEYIAELLTPFIQMDGKVAALYLHAK